MNNIKMVSEDNHDLQMCARDRSKVISQSHKDGFREGVEKGKELVFQSSFDKGFEEGLKIGLQLGKYQGLSTIFNIEQINMPQEIRLLMPRNESRNAEIKPSRGLCEICRTEASNISNNATKDITELIRDQKIIACEHLSQKQNNYSEVNARLKLNFNSDITEDVF